MFTTIISGLAALFKAAAGAIGLIRQNKDQQAGAAMQRDHDDKEALDATQAELKSAVDAPRTAGDVDARLRSGGF